MAYENLRFSVRQCRQRWKERSGLPNHRSRRTMAADSRTAAGTFLSPIGRFRTWTCVTEPPDREAFPL